jgi:hypothetical protein
MVDRVLAERASFGRSDELFDVAVFGFTSPGGSGTNLVTSCAEAGATWWLESLSPMRGSLESLLAVVEAGPPGTWR